MQIVHSSRRGSRDIEHIGSAHTEVDVELLKAAAKQRLVAGQDPLDFGDGRPEGAALPIMSTRAQHLWDLLTRAYTVLGFDRATGGDKVFRDLVLARLIEPTSKADSVRVIDEVGMPAPAYRTIKRRLPGYASEVWRQQLASASGLAARHGVSIVNTPGTVDAGYRGEVKVLLVNLDPREPVELRRGDRVAQLVVQRVEQVRFIEVDDLPGSPRGAGGYGSTGGFSSPAGSPDP